jgi:proton-coupled amino acid transporter
MLINVLLQPLLHLRACAQSRRQAIADITLATLGVICCIYTTALTLQNWFGPSVPESPGYCDPQ